MPRSVVFSRPTLLPSIFRDPASFTAKNSGRISLYAIGVEQDRHASIARIAYPGLAVVPEFFSVYVWTHDKGEVCAGDFATGKEAQAFSDLIARKTGQLQVRTDALVLYSPNERGYWHNAEGWTGNPLEATLYDSMDLTPATIAAVQLSAPGTIAVSLFDAEVTDLGFDPPPAYSQPAIERGAELAAA